MTHPKLLGISGSLRSGSFSTLLLETLAEALSGRADLNVLRLDDVPLYNQDLDAATPPAGVAALRSRIGAADAVVIATPEFNYGVPGVLKNALDWASRPYGESTLIGKPVLTISSSPAFTGGVRAQAQLNETLIAIGASLVIRPQLVVGSVHEKVQEGRLVDSGTLDFLLAGIDDLIARSQREAQIKKVA